MSNKFTIAFLSVIMLVTFLEVLFFIAVVATPLFKASGKVIPQQFGFPSVSDLMLPATVGRYVFEDDSKKTLHSGRIDEFLEKLSPTMASKSSFVKSSDISFTISGTVVEVKKIPSKTIIASPTYEITLENIYKDTYVEKIDSLESQYAQVFVNRLSPKSTSKEQVSFAEISAGDYLIIKRSVNLLNKYENTLKIDILKTSS